MPRLNTINVFLYRVLEKNSDLLAMNLPQAKKENRIDKLNGISVPNPYRWLEDSDNEKVVVWIGAQNRYTDSFLRNKKQIQFCDELVKNFQRVECSNFIPVKGRYFYLERQPNEDQKVLYVKDGLKGTAKKLIDPNGKSENNTISLDYWVPAWSGKYVVYGLSKNGNEMATLYVMDVEKMKNLPEEINDCSYSSVCWLPDDSGFFYTRSFHPDGLPENEERLHVKVFFHKLGDNSENDKLIFGHQRPKDDMIGISLSMDGKFLAIHVSQKWTENEIYIYDRDKEITTPLVIDIAAQFSLNFLNDKAILYTNYKANNYKILFSELNALFQNIEEWREFFPEQKNLLESVSVTANKVLLKYLVNASSEMIILNHSGHEIGKVPLPRFSTLVNVTTRRSEKEFFYEVSSFTFPKVVYRYDPETQQYEKYRVTDNPLNPDDYTIKQEWYESKDGTRVPVFIFHRKEIVLDGKNPTLLYGYGGFAINLNPTFLLGWVPWMERGGIFAVANIRGGGEFGDQWHKSGMKENKQKSFDDFIGAAEYLIAKKYTNTNHLGIFGGSNGGLLVSAVAVQRPDLFKAVCSRVPLIDMVRFPIFGMAMRWIHEYGNPEVKEDLEKILKWSPYHNVKTDVEYPNILFTTAEEDVRVHPLHARKMTALLQSVNKINKILLLTEFEAGHGPGKPISKIVEVQSLVLNFFAQELGLKM